MLEGLDDCHYSIDVTSSTFQIFSPLERGLYKDINIDKDETKK